MSEAVSQAIKAIVRVRPFNAKEASVKPLPAMRVSGGDISIDKSSILQAEQGMDLNSTTTSASDRRTDHDSTFSFDSVLWSVEPHPDLPAELWPPLSGQEEVFQQAGLPAIDAILTGYNVSVFAYGQTGSGKSHTVFGPRSDPGLAPRISDLLFERIGEMSERGTGRTEVEVSCFEIYNEKITDLLFARSGGGRSSNGSRQALKGRRAGSASSGSAQRRSSTVGMRRIPSNASGANDSSTTRETNTFGDSLGDEEFNFVDEEHESGMFSPQSERTPTPTDLIPQSPVAAPPPMRGPISSTTTTTSTAAAGKELKVRFSPQLGVYVEGLRKEQVTDAMSLNVAIHQALDHRVTASTNMNSGSSRSHAIIQISVDHLDEVQGKKLSATLSLVDLAGSERVERSGAQGQQFVEAKNINQSLSVLRRVIDTITDNATKKTSKNVVPFRESVLTWILMDCFGGTSFTMMIAAVSPHLSNLTDTLSTLRYASKCKKIVNTVKSNEVRVAVAMHAVQKEMERVKREMLEQQARAQLDLEKLEGIKNQTLKKSNAARLFQKRADIKASLVADLKMQLEKATLNASPTLERYEHLRTMKQTADEAAMEASALRDETQSLRDQAAKHQSACTTLQFHISRTRRDIDTLMGRSVDSAPTREARLRRFRRQIRVAAHEQRGENEIAAVKAEIAALKASRNKLSRDVAELATDIEVQQGEVDEVSQFERATKSAASELCSVHQEITQSAAAYRKRTGDVTKQIDAVMARMNAIEREMAVLREDHTEQMMFGASIVEGLKEEVAEAVAARDALRAEVFELSDSHATYTSRVDYLTEELTNHDARLENEFHQSARLQSLIYKADEAASKEVEALAEELVELERIEGAKADTNQRLLETQLILHEQAQSLKAAQRTTRAKVFPDAPKQYFDPVLSRIALDLESASSKSESSSRPRKSPSHPTDR